MFENREGQNVPQVTFRTRVDSDWKAVTTDDIFAGKNGRRIFPAGSLYSDLLLIACTALRSAGRRVQGERCGRYRLYLRK